MKSHSNIPATPGKGKTMTFAELWEAAKNPETPEEAVEAANKELLELQQDYWRRKESNPLDGETGGFPADEIDYLLR